VSQHTCINTHTTFDGSVPPPCKACGDQLQHTMDLRARWRRVDVAKRHQIVTLLRDAGDGARLCGGDEIPYSLAAELLDTLGKPGT